MVRPDIKKQVLMLISIANLLFPWIPAHSQFTGLTQLEQSKELSFSNPRQRSLTLPFKSINNLIIIQVQINGSDTLNFILDTGINTSVICETSTADQLNLKYAREIQLKGLGAGVPLQANHSYGNMIDVSGIKGINQDYFVLLENTFHLSEKLNFPIHGILSYGVFNSFITLINYEDEEITFYHPEYFRYKKNNRNYITLPLIIHDRKPYLHVYIELPDGRMIPLKVLLDTGVSNTLWLDSKSIRDFKIPQETRKTFLGSGLSGDVYGQLARFRRIWIGQFKLDNVIVSLPDSISIESATGADRRNGSLGAEILRRFNVIIDYPNELITLGKNRKFNEPFSHNMCGIEIICQYPGINFYHVFQVHTDSPAAKAGILPGDRILYINGTDVNQLSLNDILKLFQVAEKKIRIVVDRSGQRMKFIFNLDEII